jgi:hemerythrin-like domain-containing protein
MFDEFEKMKEDEDADNDAKQMLVETCCAELTVHAQVEEEIFYPAMREAIDDMDLLDEAEVEHASAKQLITELAAMQPGDELYEAKFTVLGEYVKHHIEEEEKELFPKAKKAKVDLVALGEEVQERKQELREELGLSSGDEEEDEEETKPATKRKSVH